MKIQQGLVLAVALSAMAFGSCAALRSAYPQAIRACRGNTVVWTDGHTTVYDDGRHKSFAEALSHPDLEDMFRQAYPQGRRTYGKTPAKNFDPGRIRFEPLFRAVYGHSASQVRRNLTTVNWFGQRISVTRINGVAEHLRAVARDIQRAVARTPSLRKYLTPVGGTFTWRTIAGTRRLSVHSFGAAIDIRVKYSAYWRWNKGAYRYHNAIPFAIVQAFERHGFIWGGKWYHYDTMHFEYRPELLGIASRQRTAHPPKPPSHLQKMPTQKRPRKAPATSAATPQTGSYTVVAGDTLYTIAQRLHTTVTALRQANALSSDTIRAGQRLTVPASGH